MAVCPTCGKTFKPCTTRMKDEFNWRAVACSYDCAMEYVDAIRRSRMPRVEQNEMLGVSAKTQKERGL